MANDPVSQPPLWYISFQLPNSTSEKIEITYDDLTRNRGVLIGRKGFANDVEIPHGILSRAHCSLHLNSSNNLYIEDLGSTNGTFVNGFRLLPNKKKLLTEGDTLLVGDLGINIVFPPAPQTPITDESYVPQSAEESYGPDHTVIIESELRHEKSVIEEDAAASGRNIQLEQKDFIAKLMTFGYFHPFIALALLISFTAISVFGILNLQIDTSYNSMFSKKDPGYLPYKDVVKEFGSDNISLIYFKDKNLFSTERLQLIEDLTYELEDLDFVEKSESLFTVLNIRDDQGSLDLNPLIETLPETPEEVTKIKDNALYSPIIRRDFLSEDGTVTALSVTIKNVEDDPNYNRRVFTEIEARIDPLKVHFESVFQVGPPRLNSDIEKGIIGDVCVITPSVATVMLISIALFLRTGMAALLPLVTAFTSIAWSGGFMGFMGIPVNLLTSILPSLVLVIGSTEDTHMLASYIHCYQKDKEATRYKAIRFMATHVGIAIFLTSFTTTIGFIANLTSEIQLIRDFGLALAFSMVANLVATVLIMPLLLRFYQPKMKEQKQKKETFFSQILVHIKTLMYFLEGLTERHERKFLFTVVVIIGILCTMALRIKVSNDPLSYFKNKHIIVSEAETLHQDLSGMQVFYLVIEAAENKDFKDPEQLKRVEQLQKAMIDSRVFDKIVSIVDYITLVNQEMNQGDKAYHVVPDNRPLIEQYLFMFQRKDIERYITPDSKRINILVRHNISDSWTFKQRLKELEQEANSILGGDANFYLSGKNLLINRAAETLFISQFYSLILMIGIIFIIMSLLFSSIVAGILSLIPNCIPIIVLFGIMGIFGIPLNPGTSTVAVIAIGIAIDDTIHLLTRYNSECHINPNQIEATRATVRSEALPVISTSISLALGFALLYFSSFNILAQFGILSAITMIVAMLTDLLLTPVFLKRLRLVGIWELVSTKFNREAVLLKSPLFAGMSRFQIRKALLLSQIKEFSPGDIIYNQGDSGDDLYLVLDGTAEILHFEADRKKLIARLECGNVFGEIGYAGGENRPETVRASRSSSLQLLILNETQLESAVRFYPWIKLKLTKNISYILAKRI